MNKLLCKCWNLKTVTNTVLDCLGEKIEQGADTVNVVYIPNTFF